MGITSRWILLAAVAAWGCGGGDSRTAERSAGQTADQTAQTIDGAGGEFSRESFALCEPIEEHREELAAIVGIEPDLERQVQGIGSQCHVRGTDFGFVSVELAPAVTPSIAMHAGGFDAATSPVPSLGAGAVFVDASLQPHVMFALGDLIIDVGAEAAETPSRETMVELATLVREILVAANE